jgi:DNA-binding NarL/FixJ family response regulator
MPAAMKVLLIDDHPLILQALQTVIQGLGSAVSVAGASGAAAARKTLEQQDDVDLVLLDLSLGDADGFDLLQEFRTRFPSLPIVVVSASDRGADVIRAIDLGAMGFVPKRASRETLIEALTMVMSGGIYVPSMTLGPDARDDAPAESPMPSIPLGDSPQMARIGLTPRQKDVLACLLQGKPNKLIARELKLSVETVKDHVAAVLRALGVSTRTQAVLAVSQLSQQAGGGLPGWRATL